MELGNLIFGHSRGEFSIPRNWVNLKNWGKLLQKISPDGDSWIYGTEFSNDIFEVHRYWWGDCTCGQVDKDPYEDCLSICKEVIANFIYKPTDYEIRWYKYPFRDSYQNFELNETEFNKVIEQCLKSLK